MTNSEKGAFWCHLVSFYIDFDRGGLKILLYYIYYNV